ncbi:MAG: NifX-associated nitrogen fixation protein [Formivibrio sp.]|nr:NifX-associated nitrogen fixation protein [Formivibrio sp.]
MTEVANPGIYESAFMQEMLRQVKAIDQYGVRDGWSHERLMEPYFRKRTFEAGCVVDDKVLLRLQLFYQALAILIEGECGQMVSSIVNVNDEGFGRVVLIVGRLVVLDKTVRDAGRFGFATAQAMQAEAEKLLAVAVGLIGKYPEAANL